MAGLLKKIASGLDFWDKKENKSQRDQFAREDEEERKRRERAAQEKPKQAATLFEGSALSPGAIVQPQKKQASQVASQSDYTPPQKLAKATEPLAFKPSEKELKASNKPSKSLKDRAIDSVASSAARVSVGIAQGASGLYDLLTPGKGTNRVSKSLDKEAKSVDDYAKENTNQKAYKAGNVVGEIASYLAPSKIASSVVTGIPKAARVASKGAEAAAKLIGDSTKLRKVGSDAAREVLSPENILSDTAITSKYIGEDASKGKDISPVSVALDVATGVAGNALLPAAKGLNSLRKATTKELGETPSLPGSIQNGKPLMERAKTVEIAPGVKSSNLPKVVEEKANAPVEDPMPTPPHLTPVNENLVIPDPANPMALAKVESPAAMPTLSSDMPNQVMANFKDSIAAPLQKAAPIEVPVSTVVPPPSEPIENVPVPLSDPTAVDVADATNNVGALPGQAAPRTRARAASLISDEDLRADVAEAFPGKQVLNIAETENAAKTAINNMTDDQLIVSFSNPSAVETPEDFFRAVNSIRRLEK